MTDILNRIRQICVFERETMTEGRVDVAPAARHVVAAAVFANPFAGRGTGTASEAHLEALANLSVEIGDVLVMRALKHFDAEQWPVAYGKAIIVGSAGDAEHGAAMIHARLGSVMRGRHGAATALIPGVSKVAGVGASIDLAFGDVNEPWLFDSMDSIEVAVPGAPGPNEAVLFVGFGTQRANARVKKLA
jgi:hypothetical protein